MAINVENIKQVDLKAFSRDISLRNMRNPYSISDDCNMGGVGKRINT
nr:hypothetical protein [Pedobacter sp.]